MMFKPERHSRRSMFIAATIGAAISVAAAPVSAGEATGQSSSEASQQLAAPAVKQLKKKQREIRQLADELRKIQKKATRAHPQLVAEQKDFRDLIMETMKDENFNPASEVKRMRSLQAELQNGTDLDQAQRQEKMQELRQNQEQFRTKQRKAMQTEDVRTAREELDRKMTAAMTKANPEAGEMIAQLNQLRQEYRSLLQETMSQQQGGIQAPQG